MSARDRRAPSRHLDRRNHRRLRRDHRGRAERHQTHPRLLHGFATRLHDDGLGTGGVAVGMFHLITHAFFKALLFMGAGSVIHGCHEEQDIRKMGGIRKLHAGDIPDLRRRHDGVGGVPVLLLRVLEQGRESSTRRMAGRCRTFRFISACAGAFLTAFYMTRQMALVFWGEYAVNVLHDTPHVKTPEADRAQERTSSRTKARAR